MRTIYITDPSKKPTLTIICGPTASGKTDYYEELKKEHAGRLECINADTGQMYRGLSVGTAKPDLADLEGPEGYHLFDILELGEMISSAKFRKKVEELVPTIHARGNHPVVVGGSMFYIASLFFPPKDPELKVSDRATLLLKERERETVPTARLYEQLGQLDPKRAARLLPGDRFRILRALQIYDRHEVLPSSLEPEFEPLGNVRLIFVCQEREELDERIARRLDIMLERGPQGGWLDETDRILASNPQAAEFFAQSRLIGYRHITAWIQGGRRPEQLPELRERLYYATRDYSRNQIKFWRSLERKISKHCILENAISQNVANSPDL